MHTQNWDVWIKVRPPIQKDPRYHDLLFSSKLWLSDLVLVMAMVLKEQNNGNE